MSPLPPKWSLMFFRWYCKEPLQEGILGDLEEEFEEDVQKKGLKRARWQFTWNVIRFFRPGIIRSMGWNQ